MSCQYCKAAVIKRDVAKHERDCLEKKQKAQASNASRLAALADLKGREGVPAPGAPSRGLALARGDVGDSDDGDDDDDDGGDGSDGNVNLRGKFGGGGQKPGAGQSRPSSSAASYLQPKPRSSNVSGALAGLASLSASQSAAMSRCVGLHKCMHTHTPATCTWAMVDVPTQCCTSL